LQRGFPYNTTVRSLLIGAVVFFAVIAIAFSSVVFFAFPLKYKSEIRAASARHDVDPVLVASIIRAESGFKPKAVSPKGAVGLMQIMPATADFIAAMMEKETYNLYDPGDNIDMGVFYLRYLLDKFGDQRTALMAYNAGEGNVNRWLGGNVRLVTCPFPETNAYVERVLNGKSYYKYRI